MGSHPISDPLLLPTFPRRFPPRLQLTTIEPWRQEEKTARWCYSECVEMPHKAPDSRGLHMLGVHCYNGRAALPCGGDGCFLCRRRMRNASRPPPWEKRRKAKAKRRGKRSERQRRNEEEIGRCDHAWLGDNVCHNRNHCGCPRIRHCGGHGGHNREDRVHRVRGSVCGVGDPLAGGEIAPGHHFSPRSFSFSFSSRRLRWSRALTALSVVPMTFAISSYGRPL